MGRILPANVAIISRGPPIVYDTAGSLESLSHDPPAISCAIRDKISMRQFDSLAMAAATYTSKRSFHPFPDGYL